MKTSSLCQDFGFENQECWKTEISNGSVVFNIQTKSEKLQCGQCHSYSVEKLWYDERLLSSLSLGFKPVSLKIRVQTIECKTCKKTSQERISFASERSEAFFLAKT